MSKYTEIKFWKDPGFTESSPEIPAVSRTLPAHDVSVVNITPGRDRIFSEIKLKEAYHALRDMSYMQLTLTLNQASHLDQNDVTEIYYGYIDDVIIQSDSEGYPETVIRWHIDPWQTFKSSAVFGAGLVTRRPAGDNDPIQNVPYRYRLPGDFRSLKYSGAPAAERLWLFVNFTKEDENGKITKVRTAVVPLRIDDVDSGVYFKIGETGTLYQGISFKNVLGGRFDEVMGINPASIASVYISPYPPFELVRDTGYDSDHPIVLASSGGASHTVTTQFSDTSKAILSNGTKVQHGVTYYTVNYTDGSSAQSVVLSNLLTAPFGNLDNGFSYRIGSGSEQTGYIYIQELDDYIRECIGSDLFDSLVNGDTAEIDVTTITSYTLNKTAVSGRVRADLTFTGETSETSFTFNGTTFGSKYVVLYDRSHTITITHQTEASAFDVDIEHVTSGGTPTDGSYYIFSNSGNYAEISQNVDAVKTTDTSEAIFTDLSGQPAGSVPWGIECSDYTVRDIVTSTGGYIEFRFGGVDSHARGTCFTIPMPSVDVSSNSWSDYVYSGQRDYDIQQRDVANRKALVSGLTGAAESGVQMGVLGSLGAKFSAGKIAAAGAGISAGGALINYGVNQVFNQELQGMTDTLKAKQTDNVMIYGSGWDWLFKGRECGFITMVADDYSLNNYNNDIALNGIRCSEPMPSCQSIISSAVGPLRIENLTVRGNIPVYSKRYIAARFAEGVRLI